MTHTSAAALQLWAILGVLQTGFFVTHTWKFDRFQCFKLKGDSTSASFKRFMIYSYALTLPLVLSYSIGFTVIKISEGETIPFAEWSKPHRDAVIPLFYSFAIGWGLEMTTHLEELCFWLFLLKANSTPGDWFHTMHFKVWVIGSVLAMTAMVTVTSLTKSDVLKCEASIFFTGSSLGLMLTMCFIPILWNFPSVISLLKSEGVEAPVIKRLTKFHELNVVRVFFRFIFLVPLLILAADGLSPAHAHINKSNVWTDFLIMLGGIGCVVSSTITLLIFFPRSLSAEIARAALRSPPNAGQFEIASRASDISPFQTRVGTRSPPPPPPPMALATPQYKQTTGPWAEYDDDDDVESLSYNASLKKIATRGRLGPLAEEREEHGVDFSPTPLTSRNLQMHSVLERQRMRRVNSGIRSFRSPIDLLN